MKKLHFLVLIALFCGILAACNKLTTENKENYLIREFLRSDDFQKNTLINSKSIDIEKSKVTYLNEDKDKPVINIIFTKDKAIIGSIEAVKNISEKILLPNNGKYFMLYRDYSALDLNSMSGSINLFDLNYDNHLIGNGEIYSGTLIVNRYNPMPPYLVKKYEDIITVNKSNLELSLKVAGNPGSGDTGIPCDLNNNGNVSFTECYKCFNDACKNEATCHTLCYLIGDLIGMIEFNVPLCQLSMAAACVYISIQY